MYRPSDHTFAVCAYGESPFLKDCIESLLAQRVLTNIIIATSTPNSHIEGIASTYNMPLFVNEGDPGISHDWNCAVGYCETDLVTIAHQDDVYLPEYAQEVLGALNRFKRPLIAFTDYGEIRNSEAVDDSRLLSVKRTLLSPLKNERRSASVFVRRRVLSAGSPICCPSVTYCRPNLPAPLFLDDMRCDLDWEAWERFSRLDGDFIYIPNVLMRHRIHEGSETTALIKDDTRASEDLAMFRKFWPKPVARFMAKMYSTSMDSNKL